jgi:periplasmic protein TonB
MTKKKSMYSVAQVLSPKFQRSWNECVAIVQEVVASLSPGLTVPSPEDLLFEEDGRISFGFGSESNEPPVVTLGKLLQELLEGTNAPTGLRDLARENSTDPAAHSSLESFSRALAFYERPNRTSDLRALRERLGGKQTVAAPDPQVEFERLRERLAGKAPEAAVPKPEEKPREKEKEKQKKPKKQLTRRHQAIIAASLGLLLLTALAAFSRTRYTGGAASLVDSTEDKLARALSAGLNRLGGSTSGATMTAEAAGPAEKTPATPAGTAKKAAQRTAEAPAPDAVPTSGRGARDIVLPRPGRAGVKTAANAERNASSRASATDALRPVPPLPPSAPAAPEPAAPEPDVERPPITDPLPDDVVVYTSSDRGVRPPQLIRPQLPKEPAPGQDTGYFDMVINEEGDVIQVKLLSPRKLFEERMLVAAAKAWKFKPAVLAGQAVKYRVRIPIIIAGMP